MYAETKSNLEIQLQDAVERKAHLNEVIVWSGSLNQPHVILLPQNSKFSYGAKSNICVIANKILPIELKGSWISELFKDKWADRDLVTTHHWRCASIECGSLTGISRRALHINKWYVSFKFSSIMHAILRSLSHLYIKFFFFHLKILVIIKKKLNT